MTLRRHFGSHVLSAIGSAYDTVSGDIELPATSMREMVSWWVKRWVSGEYDCCCL